MRLQKLVAAIAMAGSLGSGYANALGLGEVRLNSALNQPLDAEIELLQVRELTKNEILPSLASRLDFQRIGIDRPFNLSSLQFKTVLRQDGTGFIHVTSRELIREPFLNFLLEVHWPSGRLLREYTMLLDPPAFSEQPSAPVKPAVIQTNNSPAAQFPQHYEDPFGQQISAPPAQESEQPAQKTPAYNSQPQQQTTQASAPVKKVQSSASTSDTYKVQPNESLWNIARTIRPTSDLSIQQTMLAIQRSNPDAFAGGNINRLKKGQVLRVPTEDNISSVSSQDALAEVARQNREWQQARKEQLDATRRTTADSDVGDAYSEGKLSIVGGGEASDSGRDLGGGTADTDSTALQTELMVTREELDQITRENTELKSRLKDLDDQISTLKRLIELKDDQVAALQQQQSPQSPEPVSAPQPVQSQTPEPAQKSGFMEFLFSNPLYLGLAGLIPLGLIGALLVYRRRRQEDEEEYELGDQFVESMTLPETDDGMIDEELELDEELLEIDEDKLVDSIPEEETTQQTEDAISEADIYIAYGRFPQAAELLEKAIVSEPERADLRLKLLEVHAENNDLDQFRHALAGVEGLGDQNAIRQADAYKARFPADAFAGQGVQDENLEDLAEFDLEEALSGGGNEPASSISYDLDDLDIESTSDPMAPASESQAEDEELNFDLDDLDLALQGGPEQATEEASSDQLPDLDLDFEFEEAEAQATPDAESEEDLSFDDVLSDFESALEDDDFDLISDDDEVATKLDLARAYIDMGDKEGAQDILQEVIDSGSEEQKQEAEELLKQAS